VIATWFRLCADIEEMKKVLNNNFVVYCHLAIRVLKLYTETIWLLPTGCRIYGIEYNTVAKNIVILVCHLTQSEKKAIRYHVSIK